MLEREYDERPSTVANDNNDNLSLKPDAYTYSQVLQAWTDSGRHRETSARLEALLGRMTQKGVVPDPVCYGIVLRYYAGRCGIDGDGDDGSSLDRMEATLRDMEAANAVAAAATNTMLHHQTSTAAARAQVVYGYARLGKIDEAEAVVRRVVEELRQQLVLQPLPDAPGDDDDSDFSRYEYDGPSSAPSSQQRQPPRQQVVGDADERDVRLIGESVMIVMRAYRDYILQVENDVDGTTLATTRQALTTTSSSACETATITTTTMTKEKAVHKVVAFVQFVTDANLLGASWIGTYFVRLACLPESERECCA